MIPNKDRAPRPGDVVICTTDWLSSNGHKAGLEYIVRGFETLAGTWKLESGTGHKINCQSIEGHFKFKESTMTSETIATSMVNLTDNQKALKELGLLNDNLTLNSEGAAALREFLRNKYEDEFVKAAQATQQTTDETKPTT